MGRHRSSCSDRSLLKRSMKIKREIYFQVDLCIHTTADELKGNCACFAEKDEMN